MTDYYTDFSFTIDDLTADEHAWLGRYIPLHERYCEHHDEGSFYGHSLDKDHLWVYSDGGESAVEVAAMLAQAFLAKWRPDQVIGFQWANGGSASDASGGGAVVITADDQLWWNSQVALATLLAEASTPKNFRIYVHIDGVRCPYCNSDNITTGRFHHDGKYVRQSVTCQSCREEWEDEYTLTGVEPLA